MPTEPARWALRFVGLSAVSFRRGDATLSGVTAAVHAALLREVTVEEINAALADHHLAWHRANATLIDTNK